MSFALHDRDHRRRLEPRAKPYFVRLADSLHVGYRKGKLVSRWVVRRYDGLRYVMTTIGDVQPDDEVKADGRSVLSFEQVVEMIMSEEAKRPLCCSFCGKDSTQVGKLIAGPSVFICDGCVALCQIYLENPDRHGKILLDADGNPVWKGGRPVFVPLTDEEKRRIRDRYDLDPKTASRL